MRGISFRVIAVRGIVRGVDDLTRLHVRLCGYTLLLLAGMLICHRLGVRGWQLSIGYGIVTGATLVLVVSVLAR